MHLDVYGHLGFFAYGALSIANHALLSGARTKIKHIMGEGLLP